MIQLIESFARNPTQYYGNSHNQQEKGNQGSTWLTNGY